MSYLNKPRKGMWLGGVWDWITGQSAKTYTDLAKTGVAALSTYASYKDQKKKNELQEAAYEDYMKAAEEAGKQAEAAIALNLTPMTISGTPTTKAEVTDYTAATGLKHGGISSFRKGYARGPEEFEVEQMDEEEVITPNYLMKEEGVNIGPQVFYDTGRGDRSNALMIWDQMSTPDKSIFDFDFEIFFNDGGWRDMIKGEAPNVQGDRRMASAPSMGDSQNDAAMQLFNKPYNQLNEMELQMFQEEMSKYMATGGIAGLRKGYAVGVGPNIYENIYMTEEESIPSMEDMVTADAKAVVSDVPQSKVNQIQGDKMTEDAINQIIYKFYEKFPGVDASGMSLEDMIAELQAEGVMEYDLGILGLDKAMDMITPQSVGASARKIMMGDTKYGDFKEEKRNGGRIGYAYGPGENEVLEMDEEFVGDNELKMEEGGPIQEMAGGCERGWKAQMLAEEIAEEQYGKEFYDLSQDLQMKVYQIALDMIDDQARGPVNPERPPIYSPKPNEELKGIMMAAKGGRIGYAMGPGPVMDNTEGGIMDLGGLEKDYRFSGGFVPIGAYEKKDDVPARLSKNEFVFTADAVRAAGGGSINKGAKRMYDTMKHLEAKPEAKRMIA